MSGTNAHVIVSMPDSPEKGRLMFAFPDGRVPVVLSAHAEELIAADAEAILRYLDREPRRAGGRRHAAADPTAAAPPGGGASIGHRGAGRRAASARRGRRASAGGAFV